MTRLSISLLGSPCFSLDSTLITGFSSIKVRALLAYLAVEADDAHTRESLACLLWPESPEASALASLRSALSNLRHVIGDHEAVPPYLLITTNTIQFNLASDSRVDVVHVARAANYLCKNGQVQSEGEIEFLSHALALYRGPFLKGFALPDNAGFEEWTSLQRERLGRIALEGLGRLADYHEACGDYKLALEYARKQLTIDLWLEEGHRRVMRLLACLGQRAEALAQFQACQAVLANELGVEPSRETRSLYEMIRSGDRDAFRLGRLLPAPGEAPYRGLHFFDETHADLFFGREALSARLARRLDEMACPRMAVVGASGSGKSSLVRAGVVPLLQKQGWQVRIITPGAHPLAAFESCSGPASLKTGLLQRCLLVIDQLEELFSLCHDLNERQTFLERICSCSMGVLLVLRADFYGHCAFYPLLREVLSVNQEYIGPMDSAALKRAIEQPALHGGWELEPGLVERILQDIGATEQHEPEPGALPLLEHALLETWQRRAGRRLTLEGYQRAGGVQEAIARTAERVFTSLEPGQQILARKVFLRLAELGENLQDTRRRVRLEELRALVNEDWAVDGLLDALAAARLVTLAEDTAEVAHEALIREWPMLQTWLAEDRDGLRLHRHITDSAAAWQRLGCDTGELYRGARLAQALEWAELGEHDLELTALERAYLQASREQAEAQAREQEAQRQRELQAAQTLAEVERRRAEEREQAAQRIRREERIAFARELAAHSQSVLSSYPGLSQLLVLEAVDTLKRDGIEVPWDVQQIVHNVALSVRLLWDFETNLNIGMNNCCFTRDGSKVLYGDNDGQIHILRADWGEEIQVISTGSARVGRIDPTGRWIPSMKQGEVMLWELSSGEKLLTIPFSITAGTDNEWLMPKSFSQDGRLLLVGIDIENSALIDLGPWLDAGSPRGETLSLPVKPVEHCSAWSFFNHFHPNGKYLLAGSYEEPVYRLYDLETLKVVQTFRGHTQNMQGHCFSPDGSCLATCANDHTVRIWEVASGRELRRVHAHYSYVSQVQYSPDGQRLASVGSGGTFLWDPDNLQRLLELPSGGSTNEVIFSTNGERLFTLTDNTVCLWDVRPCGQGELGTYLPDEPLDPNYRPHAFPGANIVCKGAEPDHRVFFHQSASPDGRYLIETRRDGTVRLVDTSSLQEIVRLPLIQTPVRQACLPALSCDNRLLALRVDGHTTVWDLESRTLRFEAAFQGGWRLHTEFAPVFSCDGRRLAVGCDDGAVSVWNLSTRQLELKLPVDLGLMVGGVFSPDGRYLVAYGAPDWRLTGGYLWIWDLEQPKTPARVIQAEIRTVRRVAFHPNGRQLAVCGGDQRPSIWDADSGQRLLFLKGHSSDVEWIQYSQDGCWLVTASWDGTARIWNAQNGEEVLAYQVPGQNRFDLAFFTPDSGCVCAVGDDGYYRLLAFQDFDRLVELVRRRVGRDWKPEERARYLHE